MLGKNNKRLYQEQSANRIVRYAIKRLTVGVGSVIVATGLMMASDIALVKAQTIDTDLAEPMSQSELQSNDTSIDAAMPENAASESVDSVVEAVKEPIEEVESLTGLEVTQKAPSQSEEGTDTLELSGEDQLESSMNAVRSTSVPSANEDDSPKDLAGERTELLNVRKSYEKTRPTVSFKYRLPQLSNRDAEFEIRESKNFEVNYTLPEAEEAIPAGSTMSKDQLDYRANEFAHFLAYDQGVKEYLENADSRKYKYYSLKQQLKYTYPFTERMLQRREYEVVLQRSGDQDIPVFKVTDSFGVEKEVDLNQKDETGAYIPFKFTMRYLDDITFIQEALLKAAKGGELTQEISGDKGRREGTWNKLDDSVIDLFEDKKYWDPNI